MRAIPLSAPGQVKSLVIVRLTLPHDRRFRDTVRHQRHHTADGSTAAASRSPETVTSTAWPQGTAPPHQAGTKPSQLRTPVILQTRCLGMCDLA